MSRVHCLECGNQVVVDPRGLCPEGHEVGASGARIEHAMGHEVAHPDEPEPWVYSIGTDEVAVPPRPPAVGALLGASNGRAPSAGGRADGELEVSAGGRAARDNGVGPAREARPMPAPGLGDDPSEEGAGDTESLLRELHSLAALDDALAEQGRSPGRAEDNGHAPSGAATAAERNGHTALSVATPAAATPPPPPDHTTPPRPQDAAPPRPRRGDPSAIADAFAELSALDVPAHAASRTGAAAPGNTGTSYGDAGSHTTPTPPSAHDGRGGHTDTATPTGDGGLSALFSEGPLFGSGDDPGAPPHDDAPDEVRDAGDNPRGRTAREQEYEATLHVVPTPGGNERPGPGGGPRPRSNDATGAPTAPPPSPVAERGPESGEDEAAAANGHRVPTPEPGGGPDLSSFTARGGPGTRTTSRRRRRLAR